MSNMAADCFEWAVEIMIFITEMIQRRYEYTSHTYPLFSNQYCDICAKSCQCGNRKERLAAFYSLRPALFGPVMKKFFLIYKGRDGEKVKKQDGMRQ